MTQDKDELVVRDLGSTNGIRINGERVERGRLRPGDELSIAHIRYRLENESAQELTIADPHASAYVEARTPSLVRASPELALMDQPLADVVRGALGVMPDKYRIQVIVQMKNETDSDQGSGRKSSLIGLFGHQIGNFMSAQLVPLIAGSTPIVSHFSSRDPDRPSP